LNAALPDLETGDGGQAFKVAFMRVFILIFAVALFPLPAHAVEAPAGQIRIDAGQVLRGNFVEQHQVPGIDGPMQSTGHFVIAPDHGLIWSVEKPFPTSTIVTPSGSAQDIGGIAVKLPIKNLRHIYEMVGGALAGDWDKLESDFTLTRGGDRDHWQMILTPRSPEDGGKPKLPYTSITVSGGKFVENIAMMKGDGSYDTLNFTGEILSPAPLTHQEITVFNEVKF